VLTDTLQGCQPELLYFYPNVNKRYLRFIEESSENTPVAPSFHPTIREGRRTPVESLTSER